MGGGTTVLMVSHSIPTIQEICERVIWLNRGKVMADGEVGQVTEKYLQFMQSGTN
jgi:ABC-type polysaccharide/polyol phosphate transport system ATPase subunit